MRSGARQVLIVLHVGVAVEQVVLFAGVVLVVERVGLVLAFGVVLVRLDSQGVGPAAPLVLRVLRAQSDCVRGVGCEVGELIEVLELNALPVVCGRHFSAVWQDLVGVGNLVSAIHTLLIVILFVISMIFRGFNLI